MTCQAPVRECLAWHVAGHLANAKPNGDEGLSVRARCPNCDGTRTLTVSAGEHDRIVWHCFKCRDGRAVRSALTEAGVPSGCLPRGDGQEVTTLDRVMAVIAERDPNRADTLLRAYLIGHGHKTWPKGQELEDIAAEVGLSRRSAFAARERGPLGTRPGNVQYHHETIRLSSDPRSRRRVVVRQKCSPLHKRSPLHNRKCSPLHKLEGT